mmetsp:Transcript_20155/g.61322  ORF Transcript_20155/g.61322 Transcript_20155/m.61322 type:complete len:125 (-) Transcript_20155:331-705(-)|eukprot:scaffold269993_cov44-Tisochrysis_lutea.AAC.1
MRNPLWRERCPSFTIANARRTSTKGREDAEQDSANAHGLSEDDEHSRHEGCLPVHCSCQEAGGSSPDNSDTNDQSGKGKEETIETACEAWNAPFGRLNVAVNILEVAGRETNAEQRRAPVQHGC